MEHLWMPGCGFPGSKGRALVSLFFLFVIGGVGYETLRSTIIPELDG
jgi:hypothetical protein